MLQVIRNGIPVIINPKDYDQRIRGTPQDARMILRTYNGQLEHWPASTYANCQMNNDERFLEQHSIDVLECRNSVVQVFQTPFR